MLILESNDSIITDDDSVPLYQTSFSERNVIRVTFLVSPFPSLPLPEHSRVGSSRSSLRARKPRKNREIRPALLASPALPRLFFATRAVLVAAACFAERIAEAAKRADGPSVQRDSAAAEPTAGGDAAL